MTSDSGSRARVIRVSVPASTANLGPAFDAAGMALDLRMSAVATPNAGRFHLHIAGSELPTHEGIASCVRRGAALVAADPDELSLDVNVFNQIPLGIGLGSSAAAVVCGIALATAALGRTPKLDDILRLAVKAEGHPDNVAAAVYGGVCFVAVSGDDVVVQRVPVPQGLQMAVVIPSTSLNTHEARSALPATYDRVDVVYNLQRTGLLAAAFATGDLSTLRHALHDRLHERFRATLVPGLAAALNGNSNGTLGTVLSGAGPSVLVFDSHDPRPGAENVAEVFRSAGIQARVLILRPDNAGLCVESPVVQENGRHDAIRVQRRRSVAVGLLGCGNVGGAVASRILATTTLVEAPVRLARVLVRNSASRVISSDVRSRLTLKPADVVDNPDVDVVIECIGGIEPALSYVKRALRNGKHVITANKALVASAGPELFALSQRCGSTLRFEATVAGAIPIVRALRESFAAEELLGIGGVFNGTTNYVLCAMEDGLSLGDALERARALGYAEADPFNDVLGFDVAQKLSIAISLAFRVWVPWDSIPTRGIQDVTVSDIFFARQRKFALKLLGYARRVDGRVRAVVTPALIPREHDFARLRGAQNGIKVVGRGCGSVFFSGLGAGSEATASAILGDLAEIVRIGATHPYRAADGLDSSVAAASCEPLELFEPAGLPYPVWRDPHEALA